jgi:hypothetical protein
MPRFTNKLSGSVVNVSDADAEHLGPDWSPVSEKSEDKPTRRKSSS